MRTQPTTLVVAAPDARSAADCLDRLRAVRMLRDQVIVAVPPEPGAGEAFPVDRRGIEIFAVEGDALTLWRHGAKRVVTPTAVFLDARVHLSPHGLEPLLCALEDPSIAASGPYFPALEQPGDADLQGRLASVSLDRQTLRQQFRQWQQHRSGKQVSATTLHPACLAVRTSALLDTVANKSLTECSLWETGGLFDLIQTASHVVRVDDVLATLPEAAAASWLRRPLISACLIVRDEEMNLPECLASLDGLADEVIVYDTGSTDGTVALARAAGVKVVEGYWDDDFARARNDARQLCEGRWILWVDADERVIGDPASLRRRLAPPATAEAYNITIENLMGSGAGARGMHVACRVFLRAVGHWEGRLHEQVQGPDGRRLAPVEHLDDIRLEHLGYLTSAMKQRDKVNRNVRLARAELSAPGIDRSYALMNLGRSLQTAGHFSEVVGVCEQALSLSCNDTISRIALRTGIEALTALNKTDEALLWIGRLRAVSQLSVSADILEARAQTARGCFEKALDLLAPLTTTRRDDDGFEYTTEAFAAERAIVLDALGRPGMAADAMLATLRDQGVLDAHLGRLVKCLEEAGRSLRELGQAAPVSALQFLVAQALQLPPLTADDVLQALHEEHPDDLRPLAGAASLALKLPVDRAIPWADRLRRKGLQSACPLRAIAADPTSPPFKRVQAAALAFTLFKDSDALDAQASIILDLARNVTETELESINRLFPEFGCLLAEKLLLLP